MDQDSADENNEKGNQMHVIKSHKNVERSIFKLISDVCLTNFG